MKNTEEILETRRNKGRQTRFIKHRTEGSKTSVLYELISVLQKVLQNNSYANPSNVVGIKNGTKVYMMVQMSDLAKCNSKKHLSYTTFYSFSRDF